MVSSAVIFKKSWFVASTKDGVSANHGWSVEEVGYAWWRLGDIEYERRAVENNGAVHILEKDKRLVTPHWIHRFAWKEWLVASDQSNAEGSFEAKWVSEFETEFAVRFCVSDYSRYGTALRGEKRNLQNPVSNRTKNDKETFDRHGGAACYSLFYNLLAFHLQQHESAICVETRTANDDWQALLAMRVKSRGAKTMLCV